MGTAKDIREAVTAELKFDPLVDEASITVKNLNGDVALNGAVPSYPQYVEAAAAARRAQGVTSVHNHLMVVPATPARRALRGGHCEERAAWGSSR
jgi:osmotically-inducible protein OsmY